MFSFVVCDVIIVYRICVPRAIAIMRPRVLIFLATLALSAAAAYAQVQHSGYISVDSSQGANIFYMVAEAETNVQSSPVVLWLSGGPGCSGAFALFYENGPWTIDQQLQLHENSYSWTKYATVIYVDQPAGTGFSYANSNYVHDEAAVAEEMLQFLTKFFSQYPQYSTQQFFISGESYGGRYVPSVAQRLVAAHQAGQSSIVVQGVSVGNGLVDAGLQYALQPQYALWESLINHTTWKSLQKTAAQCLDLTSQKKWKDAMKPCESIVVGILQVAGDVDPTNILRNCSLASCFNYSNITRYMNQPSVKKQLGARADINWQACAQNLKFSDEDRLANFSSVYASLLASGVRVLIYYGDKDLVLPWNGGLQWVWNMAWPGQTEFRKVVPSFWRAPGAHHDAGVAKTYQNLVWTTILNAGHMAPADQPASSLEMFRRFITNTPF